MVSTVEAERQDEAGGQDDWSLASEVEVLILAYHAFVLAGATKRIGPLAARRWLADFRRSLMRVRSDTRIPVKVRQISS